MILKICHLVTFACSTCTWDPAPDRRNAFKFLPARLDHRLDAFKSLIRLFTVHRQSLTYLAQLVAANTPPGKHTQKTHKIFLAQNIVKYFLVEH